MKTVSLQVEALTVQLSGKPILKDVSFAVSEGEVLAITGASGTGKTSLIRALSGKYFSGGKVIFTSRNNHEPVVVTIAQQHQFKNRSNISSFYYQQRFNSCDAEDSLLVNDVLEQVTKEQAAIEEVLAWLAIAHVRYTHLLQLSNGEQKKLQLAKALLQEADWLLFDNPYVGLDTASRLSLDTIIKRLSERGVGVLLVTTATAIPSAVTHVAMLENGQVSPVISRVEFERTHMAKPADRKKITVAGTDIPAVYDHDDFTVAIRMVDTCVIYGEKKILDNINWEVKRGECWRVAGHNGSGKSTLLSLVNGDNPQAFANEIYLFDKKKGSGETIWDLKQKIGYVSPELHQHFDRSATCFEVIASGLFDTIGLFRQLNKQQAEAADYWMKLLHIGAFRGKRLAQLSNGEQRLVLLARALVKNPPLLILDEPCQGLDMDTAEHFIVLVNDICTSLKKTLVYVSHYNEEVPACVTRTLELQSGKIAA